MKAKDLLYTIIAAILIAVFYLLGYERGELHGFREGYAMGRIEAAEDIQRHFLLPPFPETAEEWRLQECVNIALGIHNK